MSTKFVLFSDIHEHAVFSPRALFDKRFFGLMNSTFCRHGAYRMERVAAAVRAILDSLRPDLVIFTGDAVSTSDPREFEAALKQLRPLIDSGMPILFSPGNHDRYVRDRACCEAFEHFRAELTKHCPMTLPGVYETPDLRFAVIDCARPFTPVLSCGEMTPETADFLEREAAKDDPRPLVCVGHFPLRGNDKLKAFRHRLIGRSPPERRKDRAFCGGTYSHAVPAPRRPRLWRTRRRLAHEKRHPARNYLRQRHLHRPQPDLRWSAS